MNAKKVSKASMVFASAWIMILSLIKAFWSLISPAEFGLSMNEIVLSGIIIAAVFTPVYFSIILDKIKDIKIVSKE